MGFAECDQSVLGCGASVPCEGVSAAALEDAKFVRGFIRMCDDGWTLGWHERNGGNASYRLNEDEARFACSRFCEEPRAWVDLGVRASSLAGSFFLVTATGSYMRNVAGDVEAAVGIVEIDASGGAYRVRWGMRGGGRPTSEFAGHVLIHAARARATDGAARVLYHAHPTPIVALTKILPLDARTVTRTLWRAMTECVMVFPEGVGVVGFEVPGSLDLARASAREMAAYSAVIWAHHGLLCAGESFDDTFGRMHAIVKAAEIYETARLMAGGSDDFPNDVADDDLRAIARSLGLAVNEGFLD